MNPGPNEPSGNLPEAGPPAASELACLSKEQVRQLLARVEAAKAPRWQMGAMCYRMAMPPERFDYVCPACGARTLYIKSLAQTWAFELDSCRRIFAELPHRDALALDESSFCRKCQPAVKEPSLMLRIHYSDAEAFSVENINSGDLRLIRGLLAGGLTYSTSNNGTDALQRQLKRLRQLFGVS